MKKFLLLIAVALMLVLNGYSQDGKATRKIISKSIVSKPVIIDTVVSCSDIEKRIDDFTNTYNFDSPYKLLRRSGLNITKYIHKKEITYYLSLYQNGSTYNPNEKGVTILFTDGTKITKSKEKVDVEYNSNNEYSPYEYHSFITISKTDLKQLQTKTIDKFKLFIYIGDVKIKDAEDFKFYVNCIINKTD